MPKRMEQHNHNMNHMMKKDALKKVENALRKRKTSSAKVPLLMGLGLPVLAKRFLNSFQVIITFAAIQRHKECHFDMIIIFLAAVVVIITAIIINKVFLRIAK